LFRVDRQMWQNKSCLKVFGTLLHFVCNQSPKLRKTAQIGIEKILTASSFLKLEEGDIHPACAETAEYCYQKIKNPNRNEFASEQTVRLMIQLLGRTMHLFTKNNLTRSVEVILEQMSKTDAVVKSIGFQAISNMFKKSLNIRTLPADLIGKILTFLNDCQPDERDQLTKAWLVVMQNGLSNLLKQCKQIQEKQTLRHVSVFCKSAFELLLTDYHDEAAQALFVVLAEFGVCVESVSSEKVEAVVEALAKLFKTGLDYNYHVNGACLSVFKCYKIAFDSFFTTERFSLIQDGLQSIANSRSNESFRDEIDVALGAAVKQYGPAKFLSVVPLNIIGEETDDIDFPRSWILPLFKKYISGTTLAHFFKYFAQLANKFSVRAAGLEKEECMALATPYHTLYVQCWDLLPSYCQKATDITQAFTADNAKALGMYMKGNTQLQPIIMEALRKLINSSMNSEADKATISSFAEKYLLLLFNIYLQVDNSPDKSIFEKPLTNNKKSITQLQALETVRHFLKITTMATNKVLPEKLWQKMLKTDSVHVKKLLFDMFIPTASKLDQTSLEAYYNKLKPLLSETNQGLQKKVYRWFEEVCCSDEEECKAFVSSNVCNIKEAYLSQSCSVTPPSKGARLNVMNVIVKNLPEVDRKDYVEEILPELLLELDGPEKTREAAMKLLLTCAQVYEENVGQFLEFILEGLLMDEDSASNLNKCSIIALTRLVYEKHGGEKSLLASDLDKCIQKVCEHLSSDARPVLKVSLSFVKVLFRLGDNTIIEAYAEVIFNALNSFTPDNCRVFRKPLSGLLRNFVKKLSYERVQILASEAFSKPLVSIRKEEAAKKKKAEAMKMNRGGDDDIYVDDDKIKSKETFDEILADSESEPEEDNEGGDVRAGRKIMKAKRRNNAAALQLEDDEEEPMNLLDRQATKKVISMKKQAKRGADSSFPVTKDGKMMITCGDDSDDDDADMKKIGVGSSKLSQKRKRKQHDGDGDSDEDDEAMSVVTGVSRAASSRRTYKTGGKGIHRSVGGEANDGASFKPKKAFGDKKAKEGPNPYAYIPLSSSVLNRRKQKKNAGQFNNLVKAAKTGAGKGRKNAKRQKMQK